MLSFIFSITDNVSFAQLSNFLELATHRQFGEHRKHHAENEN